MSRGSAELRSFFRSFMRESGKYPNYNIREYIRRKAREEFGAKGMGGQEKTLEDVKKELEVVKRQAVVYSLYSRGGKSIMDEGMVVTKKAGILSGDGEHASP